MPVLMSGSSLNQVLAAVSSPIFPQAQGLPIFLMKIALLILASLLGPCVFAAKVGDSYDRVIAEKGKPGSQIIAGNARVLNYADVSIRLRDDMVVEIKSIEAARGPLTRTAQSLTTGSACCSRHRFGMDHQFSVGSYPST